MLRAKIKFSFTILLVLLPGRYLTASDILPPSLSESIKYASFVGEITITKTDAIRSNTNQAVICGYAYHAKIVKSYKGVTTGDITVYSKTNHDVTDDYSNYLFVSPEFPHDKEFFVEYGKSCSNTQVQYFAGTSIQSLLPINSRNLLLANRMNIFINGNYPEVGGYLVGFEIIDDRIYELINLDNAVSSVEKLIKSSQ